MKFIPASVRETAFNCPHCHVLAKQNWFTAHAHSIVKDDIPVIIDQIKIDELKKNQSLDKEKRDLLVARAVKLANGQPFFDQNTMYRNFDVKNVWFSRCYNCNEIAIWNYDRIIFPQRGEAPPANADMPADIRRDYDEASAILNLSPRGAAALIRLAIQKLCKELGQPGKNINADIGALVKAGLHPQIQQALDVVRLVGNSAVHPGQIDLRDDRATAETLFRLLNLIVDKTISEPKHVKEMYDALPESQIKAIEKRDGNTE